MPRFFFDFHDADSWTRDDEGCEFETLDLAYLDAYRSMVRIGAELLLAQQDPSPQWIEIRDEAGVALMTIAFDEVFRRRNRRPQSLPSERFRLQIENGRRLRDEIKEACATARASLDLARETLDRAGAMKLVTGPLGS